MQRGDDVQFDQLLMTMGHVAEQSLPSLIRALLVWHESQIANITYLKRQQQQNELTSFSTTAKINPKARQQIQQAKLYFHMIL